MYDRAAKLVTNTKLRNAFFNADLVREAGFVDGVITGLIRDKLEMVDHRFTEEVRVFAMLPQIY